MVDRVTWIPPRATSARVGSAPAILGFKTDDFMAELDAALATPAGLDAVLAVPETWRSSAPPTFPLPPPSTDTSTVTKLYQPVHGRFYLIAAHLVCRRLGEPDRRLERCESVGFVVRRLVEGDEYAWTVTPGGGNWSRATDPFVVQTSEEVRPMAPTTHPHRDRSTQLLTGLIPVGARERYEARMPSDAAEPEAGEASALQLAVRDAVVAPLAELAVDFAVAGDARADAIELAILDLVEWLDLVDADMPMSLPDAVTPSGIDAIAVGGSTWGDVIDDVRAHRVEVLGGRYESLARDVVSRTAVAQFLGIATPPSPPSLPAAQLDAAATPLAQALEASVVSPAGSRPRAGAPPVADGGDVLYVLRTVYHNDACARPHAEWVSEPAGPFRFAGFFDPDAPARPVQITLPIDTSPRGLRQFPRNVSVLLSSQLRRQMSQLNDEFDKVPGQRFAFGTLCTLSIPIITICALILLMIMVSILNIVFFWRPFFKVCLPMATPDAEDEP